MKKILSRLHTAVMTYFVWGWPLVLADAALSLWRGEPDSTWRSYLNIAAFAWVVCAPVPPLTMLLDRSRRERAMAKLCGLRDGDERERAVTGEAARSTLLLALSLETILIVLSMVSVHLLWNPRPLKKNTHGLLTVGLMFNSSQHLDPFGGNPAEPPRTTVFGDSFPSTPGGVKLIDGFLLAPSAFPILALLILIQIAAFRIFSGRRYDGIPLA